MTVLEIFKKYPGALYFDVDINYVTFFYFFLVPRLSTN